MSRIEKEEGQDSVAVFDANLRHIEELGQRLAHVLQHKKPTPMALQGPGQDLFIRAGAGYLADLMANPAHMISQQVDYWSRTLRHYAEAQAAVLQGDIPDDAGSDSRFSDPLWLSNPWFHFISQQYLLNAQAMEHAVETAHGLSETDHARLRYFTRQIADMFAPSNFLSTNPVALQKALATKGQSLIDGLENLVRDLEAHHGEMQVSLADEQAFEVGKNIGATPGKVVMRNEILELIQYTPTTQTVFERPLVIFPPWINKFYIIDLKEKNSLIKWVLDQGYTLFVVSWHNPGPTDRERDMDDYVRGYLDVIGAAKEICEVDDINVVGYCIAGTTLALTLALMAKREDTSVHSATFFTTLTDFSNQGEFGVFLTDDFVDGIEAECMRSGILASIYMARTFSFLRSNDLIYGPAIRSYMMGEAPPAFDLLYWNGDGTNLPARMAVQYLRELCQKNTFAGETIRIMGYDLHISDVTTPLCAIACEADHIAAWKDSYAGVRQMGSSDKTFILTQSGHIAGIVNPPSNNKYDHFTNSAWPENPDAWRLDAQQHKGSWWPSWHAWLAPRSGAQVPARVPGAGRYPALEDAPGSYVKAPLPQAD